MNIGGFQKFSLIDFPERTSIVIFTQGCLFRCAYCHNPELIPLQSASSVDKNDILWYLKKEKKLIDGVCITGGEPTLQRDLPDFIKEIKDLGFAVKLDSNGIRPDIVSQLIQQGLLDYVAMDLKHTWEKYGSVINIPGEEIIARCRETFQLLQTSGIDHEFRTTILPGTHTREDFFTMTGYLKKGERYFIQQTRFEKNLNPEIQREIGFDAEELAKDLQQTYPDIIITKR